MNGRFEVAQVADSSPSTVSHVTAPPGLESDSTGEASEPPLNESLTSDSAFRKLQGKGIAYTDQGPFDHVRATTDDPVPSVGAYIKTVEMESSQSEQENALKQWFDSEDPNASPLACNVSLGLLKQRPEWQKFNYRTRRRRKFPKIRNL